MENDNLRSRSSATSFYLDPDTFSYHELRTAVGIIGALFPPVLAIGNIVARTVSSACNQSLPLECSISNYYDTCMRNIFVGSLCVIGFFLLATRGYRVPDHKDQIAGRLACAFAIGVAMFPTRPCDGPFSVTFFLKREGLIPLIHLISAVSLFFTLAYFCIKLFTRTAEKGKETSEKLRRNKLYRACGVIIIVSILLVPVALEIGPIQLIQPEFWLETIAVEAFALAWLTKGGIFLKDRGVSTAAEMDTLAQAVR